MKILISSPAPIVWPTFTVYGTKPNGLEIFLSSEALVKIGLFSYVAIIFVILAGPEPIFFITPTRG